MAQFYKILLYPSLITTLLLTLSIGPIIYLRERRERLRFLFVIFSFIVAIWALGELFFVSSQSYAAAFLWIKFYYVGIVFVPSIFLHLIYTVIDRTAKIRHITLTSYILTFFFACLIPTKYLISELRMLAPSIFFPRPGFAYPYFFLFYVTVTCYGTVLLYGAYRTNRGYRRLQLKYVFWGALFGFSCASLRFFPFLRPSLYPYTLIGSYAIPLSYSLVAYALSRYRVVDLSVFVAKFFVYVISYGIILVAPLTLSLLFHAQLFSLLGETWWFLPFGLFILLGSIAPYTSLLITRRAENRMLQEQRRYHRTLKSASGGMTRIRDLDRLLKLIVYVISRSVRVRHVEIFLLDKEMEGYRLMVRRGKGKKTETLFVAGDDPVVNCLYFKRAPILHEDLKIELQEHEGASSDSDAFYSLMSDVEFQLRELEIELVVPSFVGETLFGFLLLGPKLSEKIYTREDVQIFSSLANQAALSIENALFYRELQVTQAQLFQSEKLATMGQLAGGMAHEIHNPLTIVSGQAQIFLERLRTTSPHFYTDQELLTERENMKGVLQGIISEVQRASDITRRILQHAKPTQKGKQMLELNELLDRTIDAASHQIKIDNVQIIKRYHPHLPAVLGSYHQIQEVFLNLILNAVQAMKQVGTLAITTMISGGYVEVSVADTGPGIPKDKISRLYDPFYTTRTDGTGLGLFICQRIIQDHQGMINVESIVDRGTTFRVKLPVHRKESPDAEAAGR
ncbi:MAG: hypothetical protein JW844_07055 [Candidatus Omnitrophica bacterium]|nr:hypothetical protein [Candidatus Omnitrophota bacterium]